MALHQYFDHTGNLVHSEEVPDPPEQVAERSITDEAEQALVALRNLANGTTAMTAAQLTTAVRGMARVLVVLVRLQLKRFEGTT